MSNSKLRLEGHLAPTTRKAGAECASEPIGCVLVCVRRWVCVKWWGPWNVCSKGPSVTCVVAVSYSPTPSQVQYHRRLRA